MNSTVSGVNETSNRELDDPTTFVLSQIDIFNWGPFAGRHSAEIDPKGTAIIGPTGSGKTTLIDALMTLITAQPKYNLASTGGHESDRDLMSYIRGVTGAGNDSGDNRHITRPGKTVTGIGARLYNGTQTVQIGVIFWIDGTSFSASDRKDLWIFTERHDQSLDDWLTLHHEGGPRALKQYARETSKFEVLTTKKAYLAHLKRFFEVGENAFALLNRAAGLKQLNSIDDIFRELVLDDHSAFNRATEVAKEFDDLAAIHSELETARRQQQSLIPIKKTYSDYLLCNTKLTDHHTLLRLIPVWFAKSGYQLWSQLEQELLTNINSQTQQIGQQEQHSKSLQSKSDTLKGIYLQAGGANIDQLEQLIETQQKLTNERHDYARQYQTLTRSLELSDNISVQALHANQQQANAMQSQLQIQSKNEEQKLLAAGFSLSQKQNTAEELNSELQNIQNRTDSNIPGQFQDFRSKLADALDLTEQALPFVAQLLEVKPEQSIWRGAIERAIGSHRLRILVPPSSMQDALNWVNNRNNRLHVRLLEAKSPQHRAKTNKAFMQDGFTRKLNFKEHPLSEALQHLLAGIDRHCVQSAAILRDTSHGMTAEGLMSGTAGRFDKQDQKPLNLGWMTGFDNKDRLASLGNELRQVEAEKQQCKQDYEVAKRNLDTTKNNINLLDQLNSLNFETIDSPGAESTLNDLKERLKTLSDPESTVGKARQDYEYVEQQLTNVRNNIIEIREKRAAQETERTSAINNKNNAHTRIGDGLTDEQQALAVKHLPDLSSCDRNVLDEAERKERKQVTTVHDKLNKQLHSLREKLVRLMNSAQKADTGALAESGTEMEDIPSYLERLQVLTAESLPEKLDRFLAYLNQSSDQGVTQLLADIENEVSIIEERIDALNRTLQRVDFQVDRFLQLVPQRVVHESLSTLQRAQRHLRFAALKDDQGESHYRALESVTTLLREASDNKRTVGARALLDPRYRLQFAVTIVDRHTHEIIEKRTGSQGGSGGEKEIIASYILTASLSYALCPDGMTQPLFGTIVLDEAFSKSSQAVAGRIILALREFGLHPLFVTPNKEMRLLREHTQSAIVVHNKGMHTTLTSLSWEILEQLAQQKTQSTETHEVT